MKRLEGKVALITGAGAGIGRECMKLFSNEASVVAGVSRTLSTLEETVREVQKAGGEAFAVGADLKEADQAEAAFKKVLDKYGRIDILVNAAGVGYSWKDVSPGSMDPIDTTPIDKWHEVIAINLDSVFYMCRLAVAQMKKQGKGSIVNIASIYGLGGVPDAHTYTASKGAIVNLTRSMAVAYAMDNIRSNCVAPGFVATKMVESVLPAFKDKAIANSITPMQRPGTPQEIAYGCLYMASDEASYCNGSVLTIDGGSSARA